MIEKHVYLFRALSDATRQDILELLEAHERSVNEICDAFDNITQPTISHHLQILKRCKLVKSERKGKNIYYFINKRVLRNDIEEFVMRFKIQIL